MITAFHKTLLLVKVCFIETRTWQRLELFCLENKLEQNVTFGSPNY